MADHDDLDQNPLVVNFVNDPIIADSDSVGIATAELFTAGWSRRQRQFVDGFNDAILEG